MSGADARSWVTGLVWSKGRANVCSAEGSRASVLWRRGTPRLGAFGSRRKVCLARVSGREATEGASDGGGGGVGAPSHPRPLSWGLQTQAFPLSGSKP